MIPPTAITFPVSGPSRNSFPRLWLIALGGVFPLLGAPSAPTPPPAEAPSRQSLPSNSASRRSGTVFFPPNTPVFRAPIAELPGGRVSSAPIELATQVGEFFYPALSTRLYEVSFGQARGADLYTSALGASLAARLKAYEAHRAALVDELTDRLLVLRDTDPATRELDLRALAAVQAPRLAALEAEAEQLRADIVDGGVFKFSVDWNRGRPWHLGETKFPNEPVEKDAQFRATRAAAFYQDGPTPAQRGLLRELALELEEQARAVRGARRVSAGDETVFFFSPETTRMHVPSRLPPELSAKLAKFNGQKSALKRELGALVVEQDRASSEARTAAFAALAESQWPRMLALDELAEEIRRGLAALPPPPPPAAPPRIPADLLARVESYNADRRAYLAAIDEVLTVAGETVPMPRTDLRLSQQERARQYREYTAERLATQRRALASYQEQTAARHDALLARQQAIRADLAVIAENLKDPKTGRPLDVETLLLNYRTSLQAFDALGREEVLYANYRTAMLLPGLSPEQRRLLLGNSLVLLAQPLPSAELVPRLAR